MSDRKAALSGMVTSHHVLVCILQLVLEVVQQLQRMFQPDIKQIKKRIEDLIQREFLVRCPFFSWHLDFALHE